MVIVRSTVETSSIIISVMGRPRAHSAARRAISIKLPWFLVCSLYIEHAVLTQPAALSPYPQSEEKTT
jgi:hypothetical protein